MSNQIDLDLLRRKYLSFLLYKNDEQYNYCLIIGGDTLNLVEVPCRAERPFTLYFIFHIFNFKEKSRKALYPFHYRTNLLHINCITHFKI